MVERMSPICHKESVSPLLWSPRVRGLDLVCTGEAVSLRLVGIAESSLGELPTRPTKERVLCVRACVRACVRTFLSLSVCVCLSVYKSVCALLAHTSAKTETYYTQLL